MSPCTSNRLRPATAALAVLAVAGCYAVSAPPRLESTYPAPPATLRVAVRMGSAMDEDYAAQLRATGLFREVRAGQLEDADLVLLGSISKRPDPDDFCYSSMEAAIATLLIVPGCRSTVGEVMTFRTPDGTTRNFDFRYEETEVFGFIVPFLLPLPGWEFPKRGRPNPHLREQLGQWLEALPPAGSSGADPRL